MLHKDELVIRISENGEIYVEDINNGVKGYKKVNPSVFLDCIRNSIKVGAVSSGVLPEGTISYSAGEYGMKRICLVFPERRCDISYKKTKYENFPLPRLVFGFELKDEKIQSVNLGVVEEGILKPKSKMYVYPFSNVSGFRLCCGGNRMPPIKSLHQLRSIMYYIMAMPNNDDHYTYDRTKLEMELGNLFETLKDKEPEYYYTDVLCDEGKTLQDFINC